MAIVPNNSVQARQACGGWTVAMDVSFDELSCFGKDKENLRSKGSSARPQILLLFSDTDTATEQEVLVEQ
jgi:hypothetical protein